MQAPKLALGGMAALFLLAACGEGPATRNINALDTAAPLTQAPVTRAQTEALGRMMDDLVRRSARRGALQGAALGCGLTLLNAANAKSCAAGALAGGAVGAAVGQEAGKRAVEKRLELVSASAVTRSLRGGFDQLDDLRIDLRGTMAEQDQELADLANAVARGSATQDHYNTRRAEIAAYRKSLVEALSLSEAQARTAYSNLDQATAAGQTGLDWHMGATRQLADDIASARSEITLL